MGTSSQKKPLLLIADDDSSLRMLMRTTLEQSGFEVAEAENGLVALSAFKDLLPTAVLLDVIMPEMDGVDVCKAIRKLPEGKHLPVLMVTGLEDFESIRQFFDAGATDFITKPLNWTALAKRVRQLLNQAAQKTETKRDRLQ